MADTADDRVQNRFLFTAPYISMARLYTKMAAVFPNHVIICTRNDVIENALYITLLMQLLMRKFSEFLVLKIFFIGPDHYLYTLQYAQKISLLWQ